MITRRSFLASILAAATAPAIVKASSIMRVRPVLAGPGVGDIVWVGDNVTAFTVTSMSIKDIMRDATLKLRDAIDDDLLRNYLRPGIVGTWNGMMIAA